MLIPISHESSTVRRHPWVTYLLIIACVAVFLHTKDRDAELRERSTKGLTEALEYFFEHPYLELDPQLEPLLGGRWQEMQGALETLRETQHPGFFLPSLIQSQQEELDRRVEAALAQRDQHPFRRWGLIPAEPTLHGAFTHMFVHGGWLHLLGNLLFLFLMGAFIEEVWGRPLYAGFYVVSGLVGAALFVSRFPETMLPLVGASGAIAGCMGAFLVRYWNTRIRFFYWFFLAGTFSAPAWLMLPLWFLSEFAAARSTEHLIAAGGVAYWAHVGGFAFGVLTALAIRVLKIEERYIHPAIERKVTLVSNEAVERALEARADGRAEEAFTLLSRELRARTRDERIR